ncbi:MAG TPA: DUF1592 domain-containing protein [Fimbriimonadaceae bacterium]|nr:DUF1592 domain-containing protein [Fimbriimonadaceae bacterium]
MDGNSHLIKALVGFGASGGLFVLACLLSAGQNKPTAKTPASFAVDVKPVVAKYCLGCHSGPQASAGLDLAAASQSTDFGKTLEIWGKVSSRLTQHTMPPAGRPQPSDTARQRIAEWVEMKSNSLVRIGNPGRVTLRRLNRAEYNNTIRDLTGLDIHPADDFPSDDVGYGFDNIGDVLSLSPLLMEKYIAAAEKVGDALIQVPRPFYKRYDASGMSAAKGANNPDAGGRFFFTNAECFQTVTVPEGGGYRLVCFAAGDLAGPDLPHMAVDVDGRRVAQFDVGTKRDKPKLYEAPISLTAGEHKIGVAFTNDYYNVKDPPGAQDRNLWLGYLELRGSAPVPVTPSPTQLRIIPYEPTPEAEARDARTFIGRFAARAFRRPPTADDLDRLMKVFAAGRANSSFDAGVKLAVEAILASPTFLFRVELDPKADASGIRALNDFELASRLSYFIWSSTPDDELEGLAKEGKLHETAVLNAQVARMIQDPKSAALASNFAGQWLQLRKLAIVDPDPKRFPGIDNAMKHDMATETEMFFQSVLRDNRPITDFIDGKYTYLNARLAALYGIEGVSGDNFQRIKLTGERGGVITQASVLTVTSNPTRTSPTKRGKWVLEQILGTPPPPPPPGVGVINDEQHRIDATTLRQLMEEHRKNPMCAACHAKMDPIGFGLENFDAVGRWRTKDGNYPLDTTGILPSGAKFSGPSELKQILLKNKPEFARALTEKLLTYALGRGVEASDKYAVDGIVKQAVAQNYRFANLIADVVDSDPFRKRATQTTQ